MEKLMNIKTENNIMKKIAIVTWVLMVIGTIGYNIKFVVTYLMNLYEYAEIGINVIPGIILLLLSILAVLIGTKLIAKGQYEMAIAILSIPGWSMSAPISLIWFAFIVVLMFVDKVENRETMKNRILSQINNNQVAHTSAEPLENFGEMELLETEETEISENGETVLFAEFEQPLLSKQERNDDLKKENDLLFEQEYQRTTVMHRISQIINVLMFSEISVVVLTLFIYLSIPSIAIVIGVVFVVFMALAIVLRKKGKYSLSLIAACTPYIFYLSLGVFAYFSK